MNKKDSYGSLLSAFSVLSAKIRKSRNRTKENWIFLCSTRRMSCLYIIVPIFQTTAKTPHFSDNMLCMFDENAIFAADHKKEMGRMSKFIAAFKAKVPRTCTSWS